MIGKKTHRVTTLTATSLLLISSALIITPQRIRAQDQGAPSPQGPPTFNLPVQPPGGGAGWLGIAIAEVTPDRAKELKLSADRGVIVTGVDENGPAAKSGLKKDDVVNEYNNQRVEGTMQFRRLVRETPPGRTAQLSVWRAGHSQKITVEVGNDSAQLENPRRNNLRYYRSPGGFPPQEFSGQTFGPTPFHAPLPDPRNQFFYRRVASGAPILGAAVQDLSGQLGNYFGVPDGEGVLVTEVHKDSPADKAAIRAGDVITKVDGERIRNTGELREHLRDKRDAKNVTVSVLRKGVETSVQVTLEKPQAPEQRPGRTVPL